MEGNIDFFSSITVYLLKCFIHDFVFYFLFMEGCMYKYGNYDTGVFFLYTVVLQNICWNVLYMTLFSFFKQ